MENEISIAPEKRRIKLYIGVALVVMLVVSVLLVGLFIKQFNKQQPDYGQLSDYVQELKNRGFEVLQGTWHEPQYYVEIPDWNNFLEWAEDVREEHQQKGRSDPLIYVDIERSVFWFIGKIAMFNYDDVTFYWFV